VKVSVATSPHNAGAILQNCAERSYVLVASYVCCRYIAVQSLEQTLTCLQVNGGVLSSSCNTQFFHFVCAFFRYLCHCVPFADECEVLFYVSYGVFEECRSYYH